MIYALCFVGGVVLVALFFWLRGIVAAHMRANTEREAQQILDTQAKRDAEIDTDATPKPRTEEEIRNGLKDHHRIIR